MSIRSVEAVLSRLASLAERDPSPDARAAYRVAVNLFASVDSCDVEAIQALFVPPPPCTCGLCDVNPDAAFDSDFPAEVV